jgi:hypothetical protein
MPEHGPDLALHDLERDAVSTAIGGYAWRDRRVGTRREVDDRETSAGLQRRGEAANHRFGCGDVVIDVAHQDGVAARGREVRRVGRAHEDRHVRQALALHHGAHDGQLLVADVGQVDVPGWPSPPCEARTPRAEARADVGDPHPGLDAKQWHEQADFGVRNLDLFGRGSLQRRRRLRGNRCDENGQKPGPGDAAHPRQGHDVYFINSASFALTASPQMS